MRGIERSYPSSRCRRCSMRQNHLRVHEEQNWQGKRYTQVGRTTEKIEIEIEIEIQIQIQIEDTGKR